MLVSTLALLAMLLLPALSSARGRVGVSTAIEVTQEYDDNVFGRSEAIESDQITRAVASIDLSRSGDRGSASAGLTLKNSTYWKFSELNSLDPELKFDVTQKLSNRLTMFSSGRYLDAAETDGVEEHGTLLRGGRPDYRRQNANGGLSYQLSSRSSLSLSANYLDLENAERSGYQDYRVAGISATYQRLLSARDSAALSFSASQTEFDAFVSLGGSAFSARDDTNLSLQLTWQRQWTPRLSISFTGGIQQLQSETTSQVSELSPASSTLLDVEDRLFVPVESDDTASTLIGAASVAYRLRNGDLTLAYSRASRPESGNNGGNSDVDSISAALVHAVGRRFTFRARVYYQRSESVFESFSAIGLPTELPGARVCVAGRLGFGAGRLICLGDVESKHTAVTMGGSIGLSWQLRRSLTTFVALDFSSLEEKGRRDYDLARVRVGFRYAYDLPLL